MTIDEIFNKEKGLIDKLSKGKIQESELKKLDSHQTRILGIKYYLVKFQSHPSIYFVEVKEGLYKMEK